MNIKISWAGKTAFPLTLEKGGREKQPTHEYNKIGRREKPPTL